MRRFLFLGLLLVSISLSCWAMALMGVTSDRIISSFLAATLLGSAAIFIVGASRRPLRVDDWICPSCGALEVNFLRQCGTCEQYRVGRLTTARLVLREWRDSDLEPFAAINADPRVMEFFPAPLDRAESDALAGRIREGFGNYGFGLWAVEIPGVAPFIGFIGLTVPSFEAHFTPRVELECRLAFDHWGEGYATEGAMEALEFGFRQARLKEIVSITASANTRSRRVMEKVGMTHDPVDDFDHPKPEVAYRLRRQVLYRVTPEARR